MREISAAKFSYWFVSTSTLATKATLVIFNCRTFDNLPSALVSLGPNRCHVNSVTRGCRPSRPNAINKFRRPTLLNENYAPFDEWIIHFIDEACCLQTPSFFFQWLSHVSITCQYPTWNHRFANKQHVSQISDLLCPIFSSSKNQNPDISYSLSFLPFKRSIANIFFLT